MITYEQALVAILKKTSSLGTEKVPIKDSVGRVLKEDIVSSLEMPPFDKAAVDGYAVRTSDVLQAPCILECVGFIEAGKSFSKSVKSGECVKIMTGAPLPKNTDGVVMVEDTKMSGKYIKILRSIKKDENMCPRGQDLKKNQVVLKKGKPISSSHVALLAAVGRRFATVSRKPSVSLLNTGGELILVGKRLGKNQIYNSNGPMLSALIKSDGLELNFLGIAKDEPRELRKAIQKGLKSRILLISGGVSMGDYDLVPDILKNLGVRKIFHNVRMKPGKPLFFGIKNRTLVFGIPGNPVSNFLAYLVFVRPAIRKMTGHDFYLPAFKKGILKKAFYLRGDRRHFALVKIFKKNNQYYLKPLGAHGSADILSLARADGFMTVGPNRKRIKEGTTVPFITWEENAY